MPGVGENLTLIGPSRLAVVDFSLSRPPSLHLQYTSSYSTFHSGIDRLVAFEIIVDIIQHQVLTEDVNAVESDCVPPILCIVAASTTRNPASQGQKFQGRFPGIIS